MTLDAIYKSDNGALLDIEQKLESAIEAMLEREAFYAEKRMAAAENEHRYKLKRALETKKAEGTIKDKEMSAEIACETESLKRLLADAENDIAKEKLLDARTVVSARQSILNAETRRTI